MPFLGSIGSNTTKKVNSAAIWNTAAGSLLTTNDRTTITSINLSATQPDGLSFSYSLVSGSLPTGLSINSSGVISGSVGTLLSGQTFNFTIRISSSNAPSTDRAFSITCTLRPDGSDVNRAGVSAATIKAITGTTTNGYYWIKIPLSGFPNYAEQIYCDMSGATAWMLAMRATSRDSTLGYNSSYWTGGAGLNDNGDPTTAINIKQGSLFQYYTISNIRLTASTTASALTANPTATFGTFNATLYAIFTGGNNNYSTQINWGRANWINWANSVGGMGTAVWDNQPNCNEDRINSTGIYHSVRLGISFNNETDCNTSDAGIGIGLWRTGLGDRNGIANRWSPDQFYDAHCWLWIN